MPKPKGVRSLRDVCRRAGISRADADALFNEIVQAVRERRAVSIPTLGKFWLQELPEREITMPIRRGARQLHTIRTPKSFTLRFTSSGELRSDLRELEKGRARGTD